LKDICKGGLRTKSQGKGKLGKGGTTFGVHAEKKTVIAPARGRSGAVKGGKERRGGAVGQERGRKNQKAKSVFPSTLVGDCSLTKS